MWTPNTAFDAPAALTSGGLGTMGYGLPAAIGAQIAARQTGDSYIGMAASK